MAPPHIPLVFGLMLGQGAMSLIQRLPASEQERTFLDLCGVEVVTLVWNGA